MRKICQNIFFNSAIHFICVQYDNVMHLAKTQYNLITLLEKAYPERMLLEYFSPCCYPNATQELPDAIFKQHLLELPLYGRKRES